MHWNGGNWGLQIENCKFQIEMPEYSSLFAFNLHFAIFNVQSPTPPVPWHLTAALSREYRERGRAQRRSHPFCISYFHP